jgi:epoxyqueuosine reductase
MILNDEIQAFLNSRGCPLVGFADLRSLSEDVRQKFDCGILIGLPFSKEAMRENMNGFPERYYGELTAINRKLPELAAAVAAFLTGRGYKAFAKVSETVVYDEDWRSVLPHKTIATLSGTGWIGKNAMLVTREYGSALRIIPVLTNAPLACGTPVTESSCEDSCAVCQNVCPGHAPKVKKWHAGLDRDAFYDAHACRSAARARALEKMNIHETICGVCMSNCPYTRKALGY